MKRFLAFSCFLSLLLLAGCHEDPYLTVSPSNLSFGQDGGSQTIQVSANYAWTASVSGSGFKISPSSGEGVGSVTVTASAATSPDEVTGSVSFQSEGLTASVALKQDAKTTIEVGSVAKIPQEGGTITVDVRFNTEFTVEIESAAQSWISFAGTKSLSSGKLTFEVKANDSTDPRTAKVTVKDNSGKVSPITLTFEQEEKKVIEVGETTTIPAEGGSYEVDVKYNTDFDVEVEKSAQSWITFVQTKALKSGKLEFSFKANEGLDARSGQVTIKDKKGGVSPVSITFTQEGNQQIARIREVLMEFYNKMNGPKWENNQGWGTDEPFDKWSHISYKKGVGVTKISFTYDKNLKGTIPASIGELTSLTDFTIWDAPGVKGPLPDSFRNLVNLERFEIIGTSITSIPDVFGGMKNLRWVQINSNDKLACPLPTSVGDSPAMEHLHIVSNRFTGEIPESWARFGTTLMVGDNCLSGVVPEAILALGKDNEWWLLDDILYQKEGYGFDITNLDFHGGKCWLDGEVEDLNGNKFTFKDVIAKNKYTVYLYWASWCPFSNVLMPQLKEYYEKYHKAGLEIIATTATGDSSEESPTLEGQRKEVQEKGYDQWYNFYLFQRKIDAYPNATPVAEVYDSDGTILFSSFSKLYDPIRDRFDKTTSAELIPFLESLLGPMDTKEVYTSKDFSKDGEVMTLQKATVGKGINIVFLGDGYVDKDMGPDGRYETLMKESMEEFFAIEPYKTFRNRFNVYAVKAVSTNDRIGDGYATALSCGYGTGTTLLGNDDACYAYALKVPGITNQENLLISVMVNSYISKGTTSLSYLRQSGVAYTTTIGNIREAFGDVLRHEAGGHGFAFLADEYANFFDTAPAEHVEYYNSMYEQYGWFSNVDFTDNPARIRWKAFLDDARYKDQIGIYEGAALYMRGAWRPTKNSMMNENMGGFNAPSRWAIYQQIMKRSGETPSFDKFLEYDAVNRSAATKAAETARPPYKDAGGARFIPTAPPVIVP